MPSHCAGGSGTRVGSYSVIPCVGVGLGKKLFLGHLFWQRKLGKESQEENSTPENTDYFIRVTLALPQKENKKRKMKLRLCVVGI